MSKPNFTRWTLFVLAWTGVAAGQLQELPIVGQVGGSCVALALENDYLYMGEGSTFRVLDVSVPAAPVERGSILLDDLVQAIVLDQTFAYVLTAPNGGLRVVDVTDSEKPRLIDSFDIAAASDLLIWERNVYLSADMSVRILARGPLQSLHEIGTLDAASPVASIAIAGDKLFVGLNNNDLLTVDISDPTAPNQLAINTFFDAFSDLEVLGNRLYGADSAALRILDIADPANPAELGNVSGSIRSLFPTGALVYASVSGGAIRVYDVANPAVPSLLGSLPIDLLDLTPAVGDVVTDGETAYVGAGSKLWVVDVSTPAFPAEIAQRDTGREFYGVALTGTTALIATPAELRTYNVANPRDPASLAIVPGSFATFGGHVTAKATTVIHDLDGYFNVFDVSDPAAPTLLDVASLDQYLDFEISGNYAFAAVENGGVAIFDISNPADVQSAGFAPDTFEGTPAAATARSNLLYMGDQSDGLVIFDISDPASPVEVGSVAASGTVRDLALDGDYCYLANTGGALHVIDVSDPSDPSQVGTLDLGVGVSPLSIEVADQTAYIAALAAGLLLVDVSDPMNPALSAAATLPGSAREVTVANLAYVASDSGGMNVIGIPPPAANLGLVPPFINSDTLELTGTVTKTGSFVTVGGGLAPAFQQLPDGVDTFAVTIRLRQEARNALSVNTMNKFGLVSLPTTLRVVEGPTFPTTVETVTALTVAPQNVPAVPLNGTQKFTCTATFSDDSSADVTEFVTWQVIGQDEELITNGGLYVNAKEGFAQVRAFVAGVFSNAVAVADAL